MNPTAKDFIASYKRQSNEWPDVAQVVQYCKCSIKDAEEWLNRAIVAENVGVVKEAKSQPEKWTFSKAVIKFTHGLQYFAFLFASLADMALACFFYWSLGYDLASKSVLAVWGVVQTGGKLFAWTNKRTIIALWACALSVVATVSVFLAVIDTQSASTAVTKTDNVVMVESQLAAKMEEQRTLNERLKNTPSDFLKAQRDISAKMAENDNVLDKLRAELKDAQKIVKPDFELDAWKIFSQLTSFKWSDPSHIFALVLILALAVFFEMLIYVTIPKESIPKARRSRG